MSYSYYIVQVDGDGTDRPRKAEAIAIARKVVREGVATRWAKTPRLMPAAIVTHETERGSRRVFAIWRAPDGSIHESKDPAEIAETLAPPA